MGGGTWDRDDWQCMMLLCCVTFGVGSLGMTGVFATAGPIYGSLALYTVAFCNLHASWAMSQCLLATADVTSFPVRPIVKTFGDVGYVVGGNVGRLVSNFTQLATCISIPIAYLVLGGNALLPELLDPTALPSSWDLNTYIMLMALLALPVVNIPTLKESVGISIIGTVAAVLCDVLAMTSALVNTSNSSARMTDLQLSPILSVFGNLSFAFGTASVIPAIQRQHQSPDRMPRIIALSLLIITVLYALIGILSYSHFGCTAPANLLAAMPPGVFKKVAFTLMLLHVLISYFITLNPALFVLERYVLSYDAVDKNVVKSSKLEWQNAFKRTILRTLVVFSQAVIAISLHSSLKNLLNLIGATCITFSCIVAPCIFYLSIFKGEITTERQLCYFVIVIGTFAGVYSTVSAVRSIAEHSETRESSFHYFTHVNNYIVSGSDKYPHCVPGERN